MTREDVLEPDAKILETVEKSLHKLRIDEPSSQRDRTLEEPSSANETDSLAQPLRETLIDRLYNVPFGMDSAADAVGRNKDTFNYRRTVKVLFLSHVSSILHMCICTQVSSLAVAESIVVV